MNYLDSTIASVAIAMFVIAAFAIAGVAVVFAHQTQVVEPLRNYTYTPCSFPSYAMEADQLADLADLFVKFSEIADANNVLPFAIGGTLIGAARNGGMMAWDDDIDVGVLNTEVGFIDQYYDPSQVYQFEPCFFGYKFFKNNSDVFIDVMVFEQHDDGVYYIIEGAWPDYYFESDELYPLVPAYLSGLRTFLPFEYAKHLDRSYKGWESEIHVDDGHLGGMTIPERMGLRNNVLDIEDNPDLMCFVELKPPPPTQIA